MEEDTEEEDMEEVNIVEEDTEVMGVVQDITKSYCPIFNVLCLFIPDCSFYFLPRIKENCTGSFILLELIVGGLVQYPLLVLVIVGGLV